MKVCLCMCMHMGVRAQSYASEFTQDVAQLCALVLIRCLLCMMCGTLYIVCIAIICVVFSTGFVRYHTLYGTFHSGHCMLYESAHVLH